MFRPCQKHQTVFLKMVEMLKFAHEMSVGNSVNMLALHVEKLQETMCMCHICLHLCLYKCKVEYLDIHASCDSIGFKKHRYQLLRH